MKNLLTSYGVEFFQEILDIIESSMIDEVGESSDRAYEISTIIREIWYRAENLAKWGN